MQYVQKKEKCLRKNAGDNVVGFKSRMKLLF